MLQLAVSEPASLDQRLEWEHELLGIYVSPHPLTTAEQAIRECGAIQVSGLGAEHDGKKARGAGIIRGLRSFSTRSGQQMASFQLADLQSAVDVVVFSRTYEQVAGKLVDNALVVVDGKVDSSDGSLRLVADTILALDEARDRPAPTGSTGNRSNRAPSNGHPSTDGVKRANPAPGVETAQPASRLVIEVPRTDDRVSDLSTIEKVYELLQRFQGADEVEFYVRHSDRLLPLPLPNKSTRVCDQLKAALRALLPESSYRLMPGSGVRV
ncbi:MAG: hypothetical protein PVSMB7_10170 [Chloroflexota bacterium]